MNTAAPEMYYQSHMSTGPAPPPPQTVTSPYAQHPHQSHHPHPPVLQPGPTQYGAPYGSQYGYGNGMSHPQAPPPLSNPMSSAQPVLPLPGAGQPMAQSSYPSGFDTTGQVQPPGMKPRVTATLWEDEGSLCFQVEARGICVARREDNHMINGTKLLNVAGMTRGRRDGILKSEKIRHVVKIGPMHLKGVWIPFERALDFANKEKITEMLYPLFVHNIGGLLCHPNNPTRPGQVMPSGARKQELRAGQPPAGLPSLQQPPHHALTLPGPQPSLGRPPMERAQSFPTPPTSASAMMGAMGASDNFQWNQHGMPNGHASGQIAIDTSMNNGARSLPNTPATTPPGQQNMQNYPSVSQAYDSARQMYHPAPPQSSPYPPTNPAPQDRSVYGHGAYVKTEMAPPSNRAPVPNGEHHQVVDSKPTNGILQHGGHQGEPVGAPAGAEEEADHEHDGEYTHDSGAYDTNRGGYNYNGPAMPPLASDHAHLSPELAGSPHQAGSGRATPRTAAAPSSYYAPQGYSTPPRVGPSSNSVYNVMSNERGSGPNDVSSTTNGVYSSHQGGGAGGDLHNGYATQPPPPQHHQQQPQQQQVLPAPIVSNGPSSSSSSLKRGRDDDDDRDLKRRKGLLDGGVVGSMPSPTFAAAPIAAQRRR